MKTLATIGALVRVTPGDDIGCQADEDSIQYIEDWTPFEFRVAGRLDDGQIFYGLYGPVTSGSERYQNLICSVTLRVLPTDWRKQTQCRANFKVGPTKVSRDRRHDFLHPDGTVVDGFPKISRFGKICVMGTETPTPLRPVSKE